MSDGPISRWRASFKRPRASTPQVHVVHGFFPHATTPGVGYCGRKSDRLNMDWRKVTCADCKAARAADTEARRGN